MDQKLLDFMIETSESLGYIKATQRELKEDISNLNLSCSRIPEIELGLSNHLSTHNSLRNYFVYPTSVLVAGGMILSILKWVLHLI